MLLGLAIMAVIIVSVGATGLHHRAAAGSSSTGGSGSRGGSSGSPTRQPPALGLPVLGGSQVASGRDGQDPDATSDIGDPYVLTVTPAESGSTQTTYVLYWTTDWNSNVPTAVSTDHTHWYRVADSLPVLPSWAVTSKTMTWGPTVQRVGNRWILYFSTEDRASGHECIGRATSTSPTGPFVDRSSAPIVCQVPLGGDIDPSVVTDASGASSLLWKNDGNATGAPVGVWEQPLAADGLSLTGSPTQLLGADQPWEHGIVEGPAMLADSKGGWWLFYSGGTWQSNTYDTGVAHCTTVTGPCSPASTNPLLVSTPTAVSPGGFDTFVDGSGKLWASYSAFPFAPGNADEAMAAPRALETAPVLSR